MIANIVYFVRGRRMRRRFACIAPVEKLWIDFFDSQVLRMVKESYHNECFRRGSFQVPDDYASLADMWLEALRQAITVWHAFNLLGTDAPEEERQAMWGAICFLLKGVFYLAHDVPLKAMTFELPNEFVLHAATFALPVCAKAEDG